MMDGARMHTGRRRGGGYTLLELMVVLAIVAILAALAAPSFNNAILNSKVGSYANELVATSLLARGEAIKRNVTITMCASSNGTSCTGSWQQGYIVTCAQSAATPGTCNVAPAVASGVVVLAVQKALSTGFKITDANGLTALTFQPTGVGATAATMTICRNSPLGNRERVVRISATGRASVTKTQTGVCP